MSDTTRTVAPANLSTRTCDPHAHLGGLADTVGATTTDGEAPRAAVASPNGYDLRELIGAGGMGEVFRAHHQSLDRNVAVKVLHPKYPPTSAAAEQFFREAKITARLQHPGIPPVHEVGSLPDGRPYLAMKLVRGRTLARLLDEQGPGAARWLGVFEQVCHAVGYAHSRGVIHRDLKPSNIMVGAFGEVQVMDWGLGKVLDGDEFDRPEELHPRPADDDAGESRQTTRTGTTKGTPAYMSPEQARGDVRAVDERSDVFSLGAVLCELLTSRPPYTGGDVAEVVRAAVAADLAKAFARLDRCGAGRDVLALCRRCLSADPKDRPANGEAVAAEVAHIRKAAEAAVHTRRVRRWQLAFGGGVTVAVAVVAVVLALAGWEQETKARVQAVALLENREEVARTLDGVEQQLRAGKLDEAFDGYLRAAELSAKDPDPNSATRQRLEQVRRDCRTALDLIEFQRAYSRGQAAEWEKFEKAFARVGITLDLDDAERSADQISRHPFAAAFREVLQKQGEHDPDAKRRKQLNVIADNPRLAAAAVFAPTEFARAVGGGPQGKGNFAPILFGD